MTALCLVPSCADHHGADGWTTVAPATRRTVHVALRPVEGEAA